VALFNHSRLRLLQNRPRAAMEDLSEAAQLRPKAPEPYVSMARVHEKQRNWGAAVAALDRAIERRPDTKLYFDRAGYHLKRGDAKAARDDFEKVITLEAGSQSKWLLGALVELGHLKHEAGDHKAALADYDGAIRLRPNYGPAHLQRANTLKALGRHAEAGRALDRYLAAPGSKVEAGELAQAYLARGLIHRRLGEHAEAIESYSAALRLKPDGVTRGYRGWAYLQTDSPRLALADFDAAAKAGAKSYRVLCGRALARVKLRQVEKALQDAEAALKAPDGSEAEAALLAACVYARAARLAVLETARVRPRMRSGSRYEDRAVALLEAAMRRVPAAKQVTFWRTRLLKEESLAEVRPRIKLSRLVRQFD
jgi:tetratricopeptide (TPR) repeat protein